MECNGFARKKHLIYEQSIASQTVQQKIFEIGHVSSKGMIFGLMFFFSLYAQRSLFISGVPTQFFVWNEMFNQVKSFHIRCLKLDELVHNRYL